MKEPIFLMSVMIFLGLFSIFCAVMNYEWFLVNRKTRILLKMLGRTGVRVFYVIVGIFIIVCAVLAFLEGQLQ